MRRRYPSEGLGPLGCAVVMPGRSEHLLARPFEESGHDQIAQHKPESVGAPASGGEEAVRAAVFERYSISQSPI